MGTVSVRVSAQADDNFYRQNSSGTPTLSNNTNDVPVGLFDANQTACGGQMRFLNVTIPQGATITAATITGVSSDSDSANTVNSKLRGVDVDNAAISTTTGGGAGSFENPPFTTAVVTWDAISAWTNGTSYSTPDISTIIQEIVNRSGWASGNAMVISWDDLDKRSTQSGTTIRRWESYNNSPGNAPLLEVTYQEGEPPSATNRFFRMF